MRCIYLKFSSCCEFVGTGCGVLTVASTGRKWSEAVGVVSRSQTTRGSAIWRAAVLSYQSPSRSSVFVLTALIEQNVIFGVVHANCQ